MNCDGAPKPIIGVKLTADAPTSTPIAFPRIRSAIVRCDHAPMTRPALWESDIQAALKRNRWAFLADIADSSYTESDRDRRRENGVKNVRHDASPLLSCHDTLLFCKYRGEKISLQNIVKHYPGRARQYS